MSKASSPMIEAKPPQWVFSTDHKDSMTSNNLLRDRFKWRKDETHRLLLARIRPGQIVIFLKHKINEFQARSRRGHRTLATVPSKSQRLPPCLHPVASHLLQYGLPIQLDGLAADHERSHQPLSLQLPQSKLVRRTLSDDRTLNWLH